MLSVSNVINVMNKYHQSQAAYYDNFAGGTVFFADTGS